MKKSEIRVGGFYTDGKQGLREVIDEGGHLNTYKASNDDCVRYRVHTAGKLPDVGTASNMTRAGFSTWAKEEVPVDEVPEFKLFHDAEQIEKRLTTRQRDFMETFDVFTGPETLVECPRSEFRVATALKEKGVIKTLPESLQKHQMHFHIALSEMGEKVLRCVHSND